MLDGEIDALWQGAVVPIPSLVAVANQADAIVFGLSDAEVTAVLAKLPALSATTIPPGTYKGQTAEIKSFSAWNFVVANKDLPDEVAYAITKAVSVGGRSQIRDLSDRRGHARGQCREQPHPAVPSRRACGSTREAGISLPRGDLAASKQPPVAQASKLNSFAAVRPRISAFSSSLSEVEAKMWSTGLSCQG